MATEAVAVQASSAISVVGSSSSAVSAANSAALAAAHAAAAATAAAAAVSAAGGVGPGSLGNLGCNIKMESKMLPSFSDILWCPDIDGDVMSNPAMGETIVSIYSTMFSNFSVKSHPYRNEGRKIFDDLILMEMSCQILPW